MEHHAHEVEVNIESCLCEPIPSYTVTISCLTCPSTTKFYTENLDTMLAIIENALNPRSENGVYSSQTDGPSPARESS